MKKRKTRVNPDRDAVVSTEKAVPPPVRRTLPTRVHPRGFNVRLTKNAFERKKVT